MTVGHAVHGVRAEKSDASPNAAETRSHGADTFGLRSPARRYTNGWQPVESPNTFGLLCGGGADVEAGRCIHVVKMVVSMRVTSRMQPRPPEMGNYIVTNVTDGNTMLFAVGGTDGRTCV